MHATFVLVGLLVLELLLITHELGHFLAARAVGMAVPEFSVGFGPRLVTFTRGGTAFTLRLVPLGGYVLLPDLAREDYLPQVPAFRRMVAMAGGPLVNLGLAVLLAGPRNFVFMVSFWAQSVVRVFGGATGELTGLVGQSEALGQAVMYGWQYAVALSAYLSFNLAIMNLLPFPGLDGGRLVSLLLETLNGGRRPRWEPAVQAIGILAILGLGLWLTGHEILRALGWIS